MSISKVFAAAAIAVSLNLPGAQAQSLSKGVVPAEFPPASFQGRQYVDSQGCVFIRAGVDGNVTWVPRVTRSRKAICGFQPTFARKAPVTKTKTVAVTTNPKPKAKKAKAAKAQTAKDPAAQHGQAACRGGNEVSQRYVGLVGQNVRCGPQQNAAFARRDKASGGSSKTYRQQNQAEKRFVPRHVYENQLASMPALAVPKGYKSAWDDDRLNPKRAHQTQTGKAQMDMVWTQTVPRKLIKRKVELR